MLLEASDLSSSLPPVDSPMGGTMRKAITSAAGAESTEAMSRWAMASGITPRRMLA
jgi:hypothetical protein